MAIALWCYTFS